MNANKLTIKQALDSGYTLYGVDGLEFQNLHALNGLTDEEILDGQEDNEFYVLAEKQPEYFTITAKDLMDYAIDNYYDSEVAGMDDTTIIKDLIIKESEMFEQLVIKLNEIYKSRSTWRLTDIQLIPEGNG